MISIIGAGPAGSYLAYLLAKKGKEVNVFEEHSQIGIPVQCAGLVTNTLANIIPIRKQFVVNKISNIKVFSPNNKSFELKLRKKDIVLDRKEFDKYLAEKAIDTGAKYFLNHKFLNCKFNKDIELNFKNKKLTTNILVGADGPLSQVAKSCNLLGKRKFVIGLQARVSLENDPDILEFHLNKDFFAWLIPENNEVVRIGVVSKYKSNIYFRAFLKQRANNQKVREYQSGIIPVYNPKLKTQFKRVFLLGDAATQVKATSYGGIIQGLFAAQELNKAILSRRFNYEKRWRKRIGKELKYSLLIRNILNKFSNKDYDNLIRLINKKRIKNLLSKYNRDSPSKLLFKLAFKEPRLLKFLFK